MLVLNETQELLRTHLKSFLLHRNLPLSTDEIRPLGGLLAKKHPESYAFISSCEFEFFIYEDGQMQIRKNQQNILNLERESFRSLQELESAFFEKLNEIFGGVKY